MRIKQKLSIYLSALFLCSLTALSHAEKLKSDNVHARTWNKFANDILLLHKKLAKQKQLNKETKTGGYFGNPDFYNEENYTDKATGKLVSRIQWERNNPENLHSIEVFVYDEKGRVIRDYAAAYLPEYRNAPTQTLLSLYSYNRKLKAYRTFDASGDRLHERCTGKLKGRDIDLFLDEDEIIEALHGDSDIMDKPYYKACFRGIPEEAGKFLTPK